MPQADADQQLHPQDHVLPMRLMHLVTLPCSIPGAGTTEPDSAAEQQQQQQALQRLQSGERGGQRPLPVVAALLPCLQPPHP